MIVKAGNVELTLEEAEKIYSEKKFVCSYSGIFAPHFSTTQNRYYFTKVIDCKGYARRGRFYIQDAKSINHVLGEKVLNED